MIRSVAMESGKQNVASLLVSLLFSFMSACSGGGGGNGNTAPIITSAATAAVEENTTVRALPLL